MSITFSSFAFGCRVNEAEKVILDRSLIKIGFTYDDTKPDIFIINSCAVTQKAEHEVRQFINQTRKKFPQTKIVLTGCASTLWLQNKYQIKEVDLWVENSNKSFIPNLIRNLKISPAISKQTPKYLTYKQDKFLYSGRLMIKIQDGCNRFCSYCIVPYLRGIPISATINNIIESIHNYGNPIKEVILTAINTEFFGLNNQESLPQLIDAILLNTDIPRISFGSINPWSITDDFISWYRKNRDNPRFIHFFHIPIQSGSDKILKLMHRGISTNTMLKLFKDLKDIDPEALFGTDVIVGFPGESENDFNQTYKFLENSPITKFHIFRYSPRIGTIAAQKENAWGEIPPKEKSNRAVKLRILASKKTNIFNKKLLGLKGEALILNNHDGDKQEALFKNQLPIFLKSTQRIKPGALKQVILSTFKAEKIIAEFC
jgi:threonylcarbamoyladenosine tRNA methylthiotransferase MtaB